MAKAGYCSECGANAWLQADGSCTNGHPATCISRVYEAPVPPVAGAVPVGATAQSAWSRIPMWVKVVLGVLLLPFTIFYGIYLMWKRNKFGVPVRVALTALGALFAFAMLASAGTGNTNTSPAPPAPQAVTAPSAVTPPAPAVVESETTQQSADETLAAAVVEPEPAAVVEPEPAVVAPAPAPSPAPEAKPAPKPKPKPAPKATVTVYKTNTGSKYHTSGCSYLRKSKIAISLSAAKAEGLTPCSRCNPPS